MNKYQNDTLRLIVNSGDDGTILSVHTFDFYINRGKKEEEIYRAIENSNKTSTNSRYRIQYYDNPDDIEVFNFILGEKGYIQTKQINDLIEKLDSIHDMIESVGSDVYDIENSVSSMIKDLKLLEGKDTK
jgi:hypothetical protein